MFKIAICITATGNIQWSTLAHQIVQQHSSTTRDPGKGTKGNHWENQGGQWHQDRGPYCRAVSEAAGSTFHGIWVSRTTCGCLHTWPPHPLPTWSRLARPQMLPGKGSIGHEPIRLKLPGIPTTAGLKSMPDFT